MRVNIRYIPDDIITRYNLNSIGTPDSWINIKIKKGIYGLKQAALLAYQELVNKLAPHCYIPCKYYVGIWRHHTTRKTKFCAVSLFSVFIFKPFSDVII